jgi:hypothetical protein
VAPEAGAPARPPAAKNPADCLPGTNEQKAPSLENGTTGAGESLSEQLSQSHGVVCPPAGVDPGIVETPPAGGALRVIPPAGSPGGEPGVQPK